MEDKSAKVEQTRQTQACKEREKKGKVEEEMKEIKIKSGSIDSHAGRDTRSTSRRRTERRQGQSWDTL